MILIILLFCLLNNSLSFKPKQYNRKLTYHNANTPPDIWIELSNTFKKSARDWFISRAENKGIKWKEMVDNNRENIDHLKDIYDKINNKSLIYPEYYTQPFHGYDTGNLNWEAALEGEAATLSMAVNYWKNIDPIITEYWLRYNVSNNIKNYIYSYSDSYKVISDSLLGCDLLDIGCSVGISTEYLFNSFKNLNSVTGLDLSPYFISIANYRAENLKLPINYIHANAEKTNLSKSSYDLIVCNFILHEVPADPTKNILNEMYRLLRKGGILAIVDLNPTRVQDNLVVSTFRKWAFEVTEPHIYEYYKSNMTKWLEDTNFTNVKKISNDPINSIWIGIK
jgi:2-polyprenyl-3-methyl-5-hydroxy-6-metoxy-1,4-benzoquinol methylase